MSYSNFDNKESELKQFYEKKYDFLFPETKKVKAKQKTNSVQSTLTSINFNASESIMKNTNFINIPQEISLRENTDESDKSPEDDENKQFMNIKKYKSTNLSVKDKSKIKEKQKENIDKYIKQSVNHNTLQKNNNLFTKAINFMNNRQMQICKHQLNTEISELAECSFYPQINRSYQSSMDISYLSTYDKSSLWKNKISNKINSKKLLLDKEEKQRCTFKPKINNSNSFLNLFNKPEPNPTQINSKSNLEVYRRQFTNTSLCFTKRRESYMNFHSLNIKKLHKKYDYSTKKHQSEFYIEKATRKGLSKKYDKIKRKIDNEDITKNKILIKKFDNFIKEFDIETIVKKRQNIEHLLHEAHFLIDENKIINNEIDDE